jgi:cysteine desulfurase
LIPDVQFNGNSAIESKSLYTILSVKLPAILPGRSLLQYLDERRISVSGGSACCAGGESHVLKALNIEPGYDTVRFSFSKFNNEREIDYVAAKLADLFEPVLV